MKIIDTQLLDDTTLKAKSSPRHRINHNFHGDLNDPVNRFLNAMEPETYVRPHRHSNPAKQEILLLLRGKIALFIFDDKGEVTDLLVLNPEEGIYGAELPAGTWHSIVVLETGSVIYEIKHGPFVPLSPDDMAPWSPPAEEIENVKAYMDKLKGYV
ncbi:WbuC family cupin fold metalloprotein [Parabacteroides sp. PF5-9]|uniref:WbuC family cupin fold metalloprotein n=1 Tax=Parabacteroides sp. PF5-9 TaxID=1742404 RepID=UPI0024736662|nr:WbuC family cupin fold metalloprotein [Parabacteroides sp. PF5-9]MDH6356518.1 cupin fold WbuC family metalloprotein [Parabacteroides sp. PF5-9]